MTWNPLTDPVDYILLSGERSPGIADVEGFTSPRRWDERKGYGLSGGTVIFRGIGLAAGTVSLRLFESEHFERWDTWKNLVQRPPIGTRGHAMDISHPQLDDLGVTSVVIEDVSQLEQTEDGIWTVKIRMKEFRRPVLQLQAPTGSQARSADPVDIEIETLTNQAQLLAGGP